MIVETKPPSTITLTAHTADERRLLGAIVLAIREGGTLEIKDMFALEFDGDPKHKRKARKKKARCSK